MPNKNIKEALTFDDVLLTPKKSGVFSRKDVSTKTKLSKHIELFTPIIPANMDTVCDAEMARFIAQAGGMAFIHRFSSIEHQADQVRRVKRSEGIIIDDPYTLMPYQTIYDARLIMADHGISGLLIIDDKKRLVGILTNRDIALEDNDKKKVADIMTKKVITAPHTTKIEKAKELFKKNRIEKLPLVDKNGVLKGLITLKDVLKKARNGHATQDKKGRLMVGAAIGVKDGYLERADALLRAEADVILIDIAHGHSKRVIDAIKKLKKTFTKIEIVAGNVATPDGVRDLALAGADAVKVGIGPGAGCTTRIVTGVGVPQLSAILNCAREAKKYKIPIIADGGIQSSGDFSKALAAGAQAVMIGSLLAGTDEAPGEYIIEDGVAYKLYRGQASYDAQKDTNLRDGSDGFTRTPEGRAGKVFYRGSAKNIVTELIGGLRSSMSYLGAHNIQEFQKNAEFVRITPSGLEESHQHDIKT